MPTKKQALAESAIDIAILFDKEYTFGDTTLRFRFDARNYEKLINAYQTRLNVIRGIKTQDDFEFVQHADPVFDVAYKNLSGMRDEEAKIRAAKLTAIQHYLELSKETYEWAGWLALTQGNVLAEEPTPYADSDEEIIDGLGDPLPRPKPDLSNPTERRLKQLIDVFNKDFILWRKIASELKDAITVFEQRVKAGELDGTTFR